MTLEERIIARLKYDVDQKRMEYSEKGQQLRALEQELINIERTIEIHKKEMP